MEGTPQDSDASDTGGDEIEPPLTGEVEDADPQVWRIPGGETEARLVQAYAHSGPLPSEQWFTKIEGLSPGATGLILRDYQEERAHHRDMQREAIEIDRESLRRFSNYQTLRLAIVGGLALLFALAGIAFIAFDRPVTGLALLIAEIAGLVGAFFGRRRVAQSDADEEDEALDLARPDGSGE